MSDLLERVFGYTQLDSTFLVEAAILAKTVQRLRHAYQYVREDNDFLGGISNLLIKHPIPLILFDYTRRNDCSEKVIDPSEKTTAGRDKQPQRLTAH